MITKEEIEKVDDILNTLCKRLYEFLKEGVEGPVKIIEYPQDYNLQVKLYELYRWQDYEDTLEQMGEALWPVLERKLMDKIGKDIEHEV